MGVQRRNHSALSEVRSEQRAVSIAFRATQVQATGKKTAALTILPEDDLDRGKWDGDENHRRS